MSDSGSAPNAAQTMSEIVLARSMNFTRPGAPTATEKTTFTVATNARAVAIQVEIRQLVRVL